MPKKPAQKPPRDIDPDVRFLLANERTLLAWVRTALALLAGGVALIQLADDSASQNLIGVLTLLLGAFMATVGYLRFQAADRAIRRGELPVMGREPLIQIGAILVIAMALVVTHFFGIW